MQLKKSRGLALALTQASAALLGTAALPAQAEDNARGLGRELFGGMRRNVTSAEEGAITWL